MGQYQLIMKWSLLPVVLGIYLQLTTTAAISCNCGPDTWTTDGCTIDFGVDACRGSTADVYSSSPQTVRAETFVSQNMLGVSVSFRAPQDNPAVVTKFTVNLIAKDYPIGYDECVAVQLHRHIHANDTFKLRCWNSEELLPRHKFGITIQPYPIQYVNGVSGNSNQLDYTLPGCRNLDERVAACDNYDTSTQWVSKFIEVEPSEGRPKFKVFFDTYEYLQTDPDRIDTYKIIVCKNANRGSCPYWEKVNCSLTLRLGKPVCNYTFHNIKPGTYIAKQQIYQTTDTGLIIGEGIKLSRPFTIEDINSPEIMNMPQDMLIQINKTERGVNVTWTTPNATDNFAFDGLDLTSDHESGTYFHKGETIVTYTATDASGKSKTESFKVTVTDRVPDTAPPTFITVRKTAPPIAYKTAASSSHQPGNDKMSWQYILAVSSGIVCALVLLACIVVFRWKCLVEKTKCVKHERRPPTASESTDTTPYPTQNNDRDGLVNPQIDENPDGSLNNVLCASEYCSSFQGVLDDISLNGQIFGPIQSDLYPAQYPPASPYNSSPYKTPTVTVNINTVQGTTHQVCVENDTKGDFQRFPSCDSGYADRQDYQYTSTDITDPSEIEGGIDI